MNVGFNKLTKFNVAFFVKKESHILTFLSCHSTIKFNLPQNNEKISPY